MNNNFYLQIQITSKYDYDYYLKMVAWSIINLCPTGKKSEFSIFYGEKEFLAP
jgi:hypothetical protein